MELRSDYSGPLDSDTSLSDFSRQALSHLGREYLLNGHPQERVGLPLVAKRFEADARLQFSIEAPTPAHRTSKATRVRFEA